MSGKSSKKTKATAKSGRARAKPTAAPATSPKPRDGTKQAQVIGMLCSAKGATIDEMAKATGWQSHTVRGALAGALKKRLGLTISSEKDESRGRVYRIAS